MVREHTFRSGEIGLVVALSLSSAFCAPQGNVFRTPPPPERPASATPAPTEPFPEPENVGPVEFLVVGPLPIPAPEAAISGPPRPDSGTRPGLDRDYLAALGGEAQASLSESTSVSFGGASFGVRRVAVEPAHSIVDFAELFGDGTNDTVAYAYAEWIASEATSGSALFGSDDGAVVWLNGERVHRVERNRALQPGEDEFDLYVRSGRNRLLVKVDNGAGGFGFSLVLLDQEGMRRKHARDVRRRLEQLLLGPEDEQHLLGSTFPELGFRASASARIAFGDNPLRVRWFGPTLASVQSPREPGRYHALVEVATRDGHTHRRLLTFAKLERNPIPWLPRPPNTQAPLVPLPPGMKLGEAAERELADHIWRGAADHLSRGEGQAIAALALDRLATSEQNPALARSSTAGNPGAVAWLESGYLRAAEAGLALRMALERRKARVLPLPASLDPPAPVLAAGGEHAAGFRPGTLARLRALFQAWAKDDPNGFVALVARRGKIAFHEGFNGFSANERFFPASIAKTIAGLLIGRAVDQGLIELDQPLATVLPDFEHPHTQKLTFRHLFQHVSGLSGHRSHGGLTNPYLDNALFAQDLLFVEPLARFQYGGDGMNLAGKALELVTGRSVFRLLHEQFHEPLAEDVRQYDLGTGDAFTATYLAKIGQMFLQDGAYGGHRFYRPGFLKTLYPRPIADTLPGFADKEALAGIGLTYMIDPQGPRQNGVLGPNVIGHGSATGCVFRVALDHELVVVVGRNGIRDWSKNDAWAEKLGLLLAESMLPAKAKSPSRPATASPAP